MKKHAEQYSASIFRYDVVCKSVKVICIYAVLLLFLSYFENNCLFGIKNKIK